MTRRRLAILGALVLLLVVGLTAPAGPAARGLAGEAATTATPPPAAAVPPATPDLARIERERRLAQGCADCHPGRSFTARQPLSYWKGRRPKPTAVPDCTGYDAYLALNHAQDAVESVGRILANLKGQKDIPVNPTLITVESPDGATREVPSGDLNRELAEAQARLQAFLDETATVERAGPVVERADKISSAAQKIYHQTNEVYDSLHVRTIFALTLLALALLLLAAFVGRAQLSHGEEPRLPGQPGYVAPEREK